MKEYFNILKYGMRNIYNKRIKSYRVAEKDMAIKKDITDFINNIQSDSVIAFVGLKQIKYYAGIDNPAEYIIDLLQKKFKNIIVPTFTYSVKKTKYFDIQNTPSESGAFSNFFLKLTDFRTPSPFKSFAVIGPIISKIEKLQYYNDFAENGIFEFIHKNRIPSINLGTTDIRPICIHYAEYLKNVPYSRIENSRIEIKLKDGSIKHQNFQYFEYKFNYKINRDKIENELTRLELIHSQKTDGIHLRYIPQDGYFSFFLESIENDPYYLIN